MSDEVTGREVENRSSVILMSCNSSSSKFNDKLQRENKIAATRRNEFKFERGSYSVRLRSHGLSVTGYECMEARKTKTFFGKKGNSPNIPNLSLPSSFYRRLISSNEAGVTCNIY